MLFSKHVYFLWSAPSAEASYNLGARAPSSFSWQAATLPAVQPFAAAAVGKFFGKQTGKQNRKPL